MRVAVYRQIGSFKGIRFEEASNNPHCDMSDNGFLGFFDLPPIEKPKEEKRKVAVLQSGFNVILTDKQGYLDNMGEYTGWLYLGQIDSHPDMSIEATREQPKKKLVTKEEKKDRDVVLPNYNKLVYDLLVKEFGDKQDTKKKLVTKEAEENIVSNEYPKWNHKVFYVPVNAKNVKCTYDIEE